MKISFLISSFPDSLNADGFTDDLVSNIKEYYYKDNGSLVLISDFDDYRDSESNLNLLFEILKKYKITLNETFIIDNRVKKEEAIHKINTADIVCISGNNALKQINYIKEYNLIPYLKKRDGLTIGVDLGALNMAKRVVLDKNLIYEGIGLVDINIFPCCDEISKEQLQKIQQLSENATIYGLFTETFVKICNDKVEIYGAYYLFSNK